MRQGRTLRNCMSGVGLGCVKTPMCNLRVELLSRFRRLENQKYLRQLLGEDDRENNSAHSWLVHVFTQPGSKAEVAAFPELVRCSPNNGRSSRRAARLLCAMNRLMHRSNLLLYSITSVARARRKGGMVKPNSFAVFRLSTRSNVVGCRTGRSIGFAPARIFPV
jgi:hypothetical protein